MRFWNHTSKHLQTARDNFAFVMRQMYFLKSNSPGIERKTFTLQWKSLLSYVLCQVLASMSLMKHHLDYGLSSPWRSVRCSMTHTLWVEPQASQSELSCQNSIRGQVIPEVPTTTQFMTLRHEHWIQNKWLCTVLQTMWAVTDCPICYIQIANFSLRKIIKLVSKKSSINAALALQL